MRPMSPRFEEHLRETLAGCERITPAEVWALLGRDPTRCDGARRRAVEEALSLLGYVRVPVHPLRTCTDRFEWARGHWASDDRWPDLTDDPILAIVIHRYLKAELEAALRRGE